MTLIRSRKTVWFICLALVAGCAHHSGILPAVQPKLGWAGNQRFVHTLSVTGPDGQQYESSGCGMGDSNCYVICSGATDCANKGYPGYDSASVTFNYFDSTGFVFAFNNGYGQAIDAPPPRGGSYSCDLSNPACLQGRAKGYLPPVRTKILTAAVNFEANDTCKEFSTHDACAYSVSTIVHSQIPSVKEVANVPSLVNELVSDGFQVVPPSDAQPGDIDVQGAELNSSGDIVQEPTSSTGMNHVGICVSGDCTTALSNGNSACGFKAVSGPSFSTLSTQYAASTPYVILAPPQ